MPARSIRLDVFGRAMLAEHTGTQWKLFDVGADGKRRPALDMIVPDFVSEAELEQYLDDMFHESASSKHPAVRRIT